MPATGGSLARLKDPEYTGANRCLPCTVVNTLIAAVLAVAVGVGIGAAVGPAPGVVAGLALFGVSVAAIYFRGYLVPGTPTLTKRYFPAWLLALFGKDAADARDPHESDVDPEAVLRSVGALELCRDGEDLCLVDDFRAEWYERIDDADRSDAGRDVLLEVLDLEQGNVEFREFGDAFQALVDGDVVGKWESEAAFLSDVGAARVLAERADRWGQYTILERSQLLNGLRLFIDTCPSCGGEPEFGTETVESCCSTHEVAAVACDECGARLFESAT
ncbi:MAG: hypothetical protein V5A55_03810 [Halovenus sp.]